MPFECECINLKEYLKKRALKQYSDAIYDLIEFCLALDPKKRPSADEILGFDVLK
jgi:hypothetical protein